MSSSSSPTMDQADAAESLASQTVAVIQGFINELREEFSVSKTAASSAASSTTIPSKNLYTRMVQQGLWTKVQSIVRQQAQLSCHEKSKSDGSEEQATKLVTATPDDERELLISEIIMPVGQTLTSCYEILDRLPQTSRSEEAKTDRRSTKKNKPPPPRGMLSIQHYTDIACLLEFLVCAGILPNVEPHILLSINDRVLYQLPKSLAGRIPKTALLWGVEQNDKQQEKQRATTTASQLQEIASTLANLVLLDRFRPMLLSRHLTDVYAAIFQAEQLMGGNNEKILNDQDTRELYRSLGLLTGEEAANIATSVTPVDATLQAKAYQTLLLQGTQSPRWLRQRVSPLLTQLATRNLAAIVTVFVPISGNSNDNSILSASSQRLGKALVVSSDDIATQQRLCQQLMELLSMAFPVASNDISNSNEIGTGIHPRSMAVIQTAWAMLDHLPASVVESNILRTWQEKLTQQPNEKATVKVHVTIRQIGALCAYVPPHSMGSPIQRFLSQLLQPTILGQILRVACISSSKIVSSMLQMDAQRTMQWLTHAACTTSAESKLSEGDRVAASWVAAIAPSSWDIEGKSFALPTASTTSGSNDENTFAKVTVKQQQIDLPTLISDTTRRAELFVEKILLLLSPKASSEEIWPEDEAKEGSDPAAARMKGLPSQVFRYLLRALLSRTEASSSVHLVSSVLLPVLCEKCSQEQLLFGNHENASGLLDLIRDVLLQVLSLKMDSPQDTQKEESALSETDPLAALGHILNESQNETLFAIASIVMSLLIAILEMGSKERSIEEEAKLQEFIPILTELSDPEDIPGLPKEEAAAMADMSGYAMSLVATRKANVRGEEPNSHLTSPSVPTSPEERLRKVLKDAEEDLKSTQPPLRARGMVSLGKLARGFSGALVQERARPKIEELDDAGNPIGEDETFFVKEVFRLAMMALSDPESYVYLAAIQTVVALCDLNPRTVLPMLATSVVTGKVELQDGNDGGSIELSREQRIKLSDALMFSIRRRAVTVEYVPMLVNVMLGANENNGLIAAQGDKNSVGDQLLIQEKTTNYFLGEDRQKEEETSKREKLQEQDVRVRTGGPIFDTEEADVVHAVRISVLAELLSVSAPSSMSKYMSVFIPLVVDTLQLETSRLVTRAAALLAREIYSVLLREGEELAMHLESGDGSHTSNSDAAGIPFAAALVSSGEERLQTALKQYIAGNSATASHIQDEATLVRCEEGIQLRDEAEEQGIFLAARVVLEDQQALEKIPSILRVSSSRAASSSIKINPRETLE